MAAEGKDMDGMDIDLDELRANLSKYKGTVYMYQDIKLLVHTACTWIQMAENLATSNLPFQAFEGFKQTQNKNNFSNPVRGL